MTRGVIGADDGVGVDVVVVDVGDRFEKEMTDVDGDVVTVAHGERAVDSDRGVDGKTVPEPADLRCADAEHARCHGRVADAPWLLDG